MLKETPNSEKQHETAFVKPGAFDYKVTQGCLKKQKPETCDHEAGKVVSRKVNKQ